MVVAHLEPGSFRALLRQVHQGIVNRLGRPRVEHDRVAVAGAVTVFACAVDGIDGEHPVALRGESTEVTRSFFGLDPAAANGGAHVTKGGHQDLLHRQIGERERVGVRGAGMFSGE